MSDSIIHIIPQDPFYKAPESAQQSIKSFLQTQIPCDAIEVKTYRTPVFVDCGENLERICCPECNAELALTWWKKAMNKAWKREFTSLKTKTPCCKKTVSLNALDYWFPCGFASFQISFWNPKLPEADALTDTVEAMLGTAVRVILEHI